jgi:hypothetical protein
MTLVKSPTDQAYILYIESIDSSSGYFCYTRLFHEYQQIADIPDCQLKIIVNFNYCKFIDHFGVAFLGGLAHAIKYRQGQLTFNWSTMRPDIHMNLSQNGFVHEFDNDVKPWLGNSIPFRRDCSFDFHQIYDYLENKWLGQGWIDVDATQKEKIISNVSEIYANAFEHGQSQIGVFSCGQYYPKEKKLALTTIDFGVGIAHTVKSLPAHSKISTEKAIEWAFQPGNSTKSQTMSRGRGLQLLQNFVTQNRGILTICTNDGQVTIEDNSTKYTHIHKHFSGTVVNIMLQCDGSDHCLAT